MPSYLRAPSDAVCWNCDRHVDETIRVTLRMPSGGAATFALCRPCYDAIFPAVAEVAGQVGIRLECAAAVLRSTR